MPYLEGEFAVEKIVWGGGTKSDPMRLVYWQGYGSEGDTWQTRSDVEEEPALATFEGLSPTLIQS
eukprot:469258-Prymnesium_polylepis.1